MSFSIGVPGSWKIPGSYKQVDFAQGESGASGGNRKPQLIAKMLPSGLATPNVETVVNSEDQLIELTGSGSDAHRAGRAFFKQAGNVALYLLPYAETSGSGATKADGYVHLSGTANATGYIRITAIGEETLVNVFPGDTAASVATKLAGIQAGRSYLPFDSNLTNTSRVTMSAKHNGVSMNGQIRFYAENYNTGLTMTVSGASLGTGFGTLGADGTTTENSNVNAALANQGSDRRYWKGYVTANATTNGYIKSHLVNKSSGLTSMSETAMFASVSSLASVQVVATGLNYERMSVLNQPNSQHDVAELAGIHLGFRVYVETQDPTRAADGFKPSSLLPLFKSETKLIDNDVNEGILDGVTVVTQRDNAAYVVKPVTTRSKDTVTGQIDDQRVCDTSVPSGADYALDYVSDSVWVTYANKKVVDDPKTPQGVVDMNKVARLPVGVVCPELIKGFIKGKVRDLEKDAIIVDADDSISKLAVRLSPASPTRVEVFLPFTVINSIHQVTTRAAEVGKR